MIWTENDFGYDSPIKMILGDVQTTIDENCVKVVQSYGYDVNVEELKKALNYDRDQYQQGYMKGFISAKEKFYKQAEWGKWVISEIRCPNCLEYFQTDCYSMGELDKCPNCGAKMITDESQ